MAEREHYLRINDAEHRLLYVISDAHIETAEEVDAFFEMLEHLEKKEHRVAFLGDIFELWIALKGFEAPCHSRFLAWCERQKCKPIFIEGNHEFYVNQIYAGRAFISDGATISPPGIIVYNQIALGHGDRYSRALGYRSFRAAIRNPVTKFLLRILPFGRKLARRIAYMMRRENKASYVLPMDRIENYAKFLVNKTQTKKVVLGHFHQYHQTEAHPIFVLLPAWQQQQQIAFLDTETGELQCGRWQEIEKRS